MSLRRTTLDDLARIIDKYIEIDEERIDRLSALYPRKAAEQNAITWRACRKRQLAESRPYLSAFLKDNSAKTAEELQEIAEKLSPGGVHTGGLLVDLVRENVWDADPLLVAALIYYNWHGGKAGFQFLPDPEQTDEGEYIDFVDELSRVLEEGTDCDPRRVLTGDDRAFYDSLPERFTVYRGCHGIAFDLARLGVCWTVKREVAEWFAHRGDRGGEARMPVLATAQVHKRSVRLAKASEFEVVVTPWKARQLKCRKRRKQPEMVWRSAASG